MCGLAKGVRVVGRKPNSKGESDKALYGKTACSVVKSGVNWLISLVVGLVVVVVGGVLTHNLSRRRDRQTAKRNAATKFRAAFLTALSGLYPLPTNWPDDINRFLRGVFPTLQSAVAEFRPFVPFWRRRAFDRAWFKYRCGTGRQIDLQNYLHYIEFGSNPNAKEIFRRNVAALLSFADKT
jgi:hypothetical protein